MTILKIVAYKYLDEITQATLLIIGGVHKNPGPITREKDQLQIITKNVRGMIEVKKKKLIIMSKQSNTLCSGFYQKTLIGVLAISSTGTYAGIGMVC